MAADWNIIKAEYIAGGTSMRKLSEKYGVPFATLRDRSDREGWVKSKKQAQQILVEKTAQKVASVAANNAATAERIREKLLNRLEREIDNLPENIGSQTQRAIIDNTYDGKGRRLTKVKEARTEFSLRDLTTAYKNLTSDMKKPEDAETLDKLDELLEAAWNVAYTQTS